MLSPKVKQFIQTPELMRKILDNTCNRQ